jgi:8-oxo-dGTP pyrophosphatase MutT (NUDIX family)
MMAHNPKRPDRFVGHLYPQVIPDPDEVLPGGPAPWASLDVEEKTGLTLERVVRRFRDAGRLLETNSPPDQPAELETVGDGVPVPITRRSAVLVALFEEDGECHVVLTRRSLSLRHHKGEIALPGGRCDKGESALEAAIREAHEEVGLDPALVEPLAWLNPIVTLASGSSIWPIVGVLMGRPEFSINADEVDRVFTVALRDLTAEGSFVEERWKRTQPRFGSAPDGSFPIFFFKVPGDIIWGATGRILTELLSLATGALMPENRGP